MSIQESKKFAIRVMVELATHPVLQDGVKSDGRGLPKKHLDRIAGAAETVFTFNNIPNEQTLVDALVNEDGHEADSFNGCAGFDDLQLAVNKYRNSL